MDASYGNSSKLRPTGLELSYVAALQSTTKVRPAHCHVAGRH
jgi:hypothetical protein